MSANVNRVAIVGAGPAGIAAATSLRASGWGGAVVVFSDEAERPYERFALSKTFLVEAQQWSPPLLESASALEALGVGIELETPVLGLARGAAEIRLMHGFGESGWDRVLLATGAAPRRLGLAGESLAGVRHLRTAADARGLRQELGRAGRVVVVGAGALGLELAAAARSIGKAVTVVEASATVLNRIPVPAAAQLLREQHEAHGVEIRTETMPVAFAGEVSLAGVELADGTEIPADLALVAVGADPRVDLAIGAGLAIDNGITVDSAFRSSDERIFAAGDVASVWHEAFGRSVRTEHWLTSAEQGRLAGVSVVGDDGVAYRGVPEFWSDQYDLHLQCVGMLEPGDELVAHGDLSEPTGAFWLAARDGCLIGAVGVSVGTGVARVAKAVRVLLESEQLVAVDSLEDPVRELRQAARKANRSITEEGALP